MGDLRGTLAGVADRLNDTVATLGDPTAAEAEVESASAAWHDQTRAWLARALAAEEIDTCRAWLDMAVRLTAIMQGLPGEPVAPAPCYVPVGAFQRDVRAFARPRRVPNRLTATLAAQQRRTPAQPARPDASGQPPEQDPGADSHSAAAGPRGELAALPGLASVKKQLAVLVTVAEAEAARRQAGIILRPAWRNLAFAGPAGSGKSRVAAILARIYRAKPRGAAARCRIENGSVR
jgi:hypothetical protein